jgi:methylmalonyl-CoA mutase cobalamin-binding domain/chain
MVKILAAVFRLTAARADVFGKSPRLLRLESAYCKCSPSLSSSLKSFKRQVDSRIYLLNGNNGAVFFKRRGWLLRICKMADEEEIILSELDDDELVLQMHDDLYDGLKEEVEEGTRILLDRGWTPYDILTKALVEGMRIVGIDFRDGILFVPEVLLSANAMKAGMTILRPLLAETGAPKQGSMVIGTVKGDIHDIGKNLVSMMMEGAGFDVIDLGINTDVDKYLAALEEHKPDILGMSALLTTTMPYMKVVIDTMKEKGIRDDYIILVGGAPLNEEFGKAIGADAYCRDAAVAVETAKTFILRKHNQM